MDTKASDITIDLACLYYSVATIHSSTTSSVNSAFSDYITATSLIHKQQQQRCLHPVSPATLIIRYQHPLPPYPPSLTRTGNPEEPEWLYSDLPNYSPSHEQHDPERRESIESYGKFADDEEDNDSRNNYGNHSSYSDGSGFNGGYQVRRGS